MTPPKKMVPKAMSLKQLRHTAAWGSVAGALLLVPGHSHAQDDSKRAQREREAIRRSQQALRDAQEQQATLQREKSVLLQEKQALDDAAKTAGRQAAANQSQLRGLRAEVDRLTADLKTAHEKAQQERTAAAEREAALSRQLDQQQAALAERTAVSTGLAELLSRSTQSLADAEKKNRDLYALALQAVEAYRDKGLGATLAHREPVLGLAAVKLDNRSEELRAQLEALRGSTPQR